MAAHLAGLFWKQVETRQEERAFWDWAIIETLRLIKGLFCVAVPRVDVHAEWPFALGQADDADDRRATPPGSALASDIAGWRAGS